MALVRGLVLLLLLGAGVCFALFAVTGRQDYKRWGLSVLKWTLLAAFVFFALMIMERLA